MKAFKITLVLLIICQAVIAQKAKPEERAKMKVEKMEKVIELNPNQKSEIMEIVLASTLKIKAIRENGNNDKEAIKAIYQAERNEIKKLLTPEQVTALKEVRKTAMAKRKATKKELRTYHKHNVKPVVSAKRAEFNKLLSLEDQKAIESARTLRTTARTAKKDTESNPNKEEMKVNRNEIKTLLQPIALRHKEELQEIKTELKPIFDAAKTHKETIVADTHLNQKRRKNDPVSEGRFAYRFLLSE